MAFDGTLKFDTEIVTEGFKSGLEKIGSFAKKGMALVAGAVTAASGAMVALGKSALDAYADYEQLTGGVSTLFGTQDRSLEEYAASVGKSVDEARGEYDKLLQAQNEVLDNASEAFRTAGLSQNEYMETVTSFSAALIASLGGDTLKAAEVADRAIVDMADNANKMGSSMESIQNAYQGFAKQNYTMLDNLKLGYGGTKSEMERLLADAEAISGVHYDIESYADVVEAIHVIQEEMHISGISAEEAAELVASGALTEEEAFARMGTTAKEAATTIQGSLASAKSAFSNMLIGIADDSQDFDKLINDCISTATTAAENILPRIETILGGIGKLVSSMSDVIAKALVDFSSYIPDLVSAGVSLVDAIAQGLIDNAGVITEALLDAGMQLLDGILTILPKLFEIGALIIETLIDGFSQRLEDISEAAIEIGVQLLDVLLTIGPKLLDLGAQLLTSLLEGITSHIGDITDMVKSFISTITEVIVSNAPAIMAAAAEMLGALVTGITECLPDLIDAAISIVVALVKGLYDNLPTLIRAVVESIPILINALISSIPQLLNGITEMIKAIVDYIPELIEILIENLPTIIVAIVEALIEAIPQILEAAVQMFMAIVEAIPEIIVALVVGLGELLSKIDDFLVKIIVAIVQWALEMREKARQAAKDFLEGVVEFFKELPHKIGEFIGQAIGNIVKWALEMREKARDAAKDFLDNVVDFFKELPGKIWDNLTSAIKNVIAWGLELREKAKSAASDMFHNIVDTIKELPGKMLELGKNMVEGLWNGIKNMGQWIKDKITGFADGVIGGFKSVFGISSPSKVMRDSVGRYLAEGIGVGFMEEMPDIAEAAREALSNLDLNAPKVGIDIIDPMAELPALSQSDVEARSYPIIADDAIMAIATQRLMIEKSDVLPSATSDIVNNQYTYNNTVNNSNQQSSEPQLRSLTAQFIVGEEIVAEGVLDLVDEAIDERQGLRVQMKKRGVTT